MKLAAYPSRNKRKKKKMTIRPNLKAGNVPKDPNKNESKPINV
jgi:hypothetical protein